MSLLPAAHGGEQNRRLPARPRRNVVSIIDLVIEALVNECGISYDRLYDLASSFVTEAPDREPVKFGIALLGRFRQPGDVEFFQTLGRHDEFTLFCAVAIAIVKPSDDSDEALWTLTRNVTGYRGCKKETASRSC